MAPLITVVLVKDFNTAKTRLAPSIPPSERRRLARMTARRALGAARPPTLLVTNSAEAAVMGREHGAEVLLEAVAGGQNLAARRGIEHAVVRGADAVLVLSSDLPLVDSEALDALLRHAAHASGPVAVAAAARGRGGTNALLLRPPTALDLHFGEASLGAFAADARGRGVKFVEHHDPRLALDLDLPDDVEVLRAVTP